MGDLTPTDEQAHILDLSKGTGNNLIINAFAGCGKTATLQMIERASRQKPILYLVFNKKNKEEAEEKMSAYTTVLTLNGQGHRIWGRQTGKKLVPNTAKCKDILRVEINLLPKRLQDEAWEVFYEVNEGVAMAKALGYIPEGKFEAARRLCTREDLASRLNEEPSDLTLDLIDTVLLSSIRQAYNGLIDFNDQVYMPALFGGPFPQFPLVLVDEAQDLNPVNHAMLDRLCKRRVMAVGDPCQAIYGFRGAMQGGMAALTERYKMRSADLSVSFRCPKAIVEHARWRVPQFKWLKEGGRVEVLSELRISGIPDNATILCRNNAPLFRLAMVLLANRRSVSVAGSDIGPRMLAQMRKLGPEGLAQKGVLEAIAEWLHERLAKENKTAEDMAACMRVFAGFGKTLGQAMAYAEDLFKQQGSIKLMTGHKAKGLEFDHVIHLDPQLIRDHEQDLNLRYVIQTRSRNCYFEVDSPHIAA